MGDSYTVPDRSIRICADRGGTFCDVHASYPDPQHPSTRKELVVKLLSVDSGYPDAPTEGIRRVLEHVEGRSIPRGQVLNTDKIDYIRLSTTVATNALLERKGQKHALVITHGFRDLLLIGTQARPKIFDLAIKRPSPLYTAVLEVDERVTLVGYTSDPESAENSVKFDREGKVVGGKMDDVGPGEEVVQGLSGEAVRILRRPDPSKILQDLRSLRSQGYTSLAVVLVHSYTFPAHELLVGQLAQEAGFEHVSLSSQLLPMIKLVPRGISCTADAYLTPILQSYLDGFFKGFDSKLRGHPHSSSPSASPSHSQSESESRSRPQDQDQLQLPAQGPRVEFMSSDGGLLDLENFNGLKSILSGPAGGVVGYALTSWDEEEKVSVIGIDVGGTSTDVSRFAGRYETVYETTTAGITIQSPQLDINTVAAGGGSCLFWRNGLFNAGPESAGAHPGPVCYRKGGMLAVTDANLFLGRLLPEYFPKIFGPGEDEPLDGAASARAFEALAQEIRRDTNRDMGLDEIVYGFVKVANETMCRPIRALTEARGFSTAKHILASFGGAGGQHAVEIARLLGMKKILIHKYSSILSAYGLALADRIYERQEPSSVTYSPSSLVQLRQRIDTLEADVRAELSRQGFAAENILTEPFLNMRFDGTDTALMVPAPADGSWDFERRFKEEYRQEFGFVLEDKGVVVDDLKVRGTGKTYTSLGPSVHQEMKTLRTRLVGEEKISMHTKVFFEQTGRVDTPVYELDKLEVGDQIKGPAMVIDNTQTIVLDSGSKATVTSGHLYIVLE
ncbi:cytoplasm protein [Dacryopinax primogenitus]|uniref:Cytoplasm protein n=1 Tax=Dacryopinax primogenitus (strain DJM 731) TaxID=1858805 RepID=M5G2Q3_DACPD|nr:cytoplasm protein [Dacryopinax primogenitus]EJT98042.1 cytoplasm protein [Dacryopinax primogenitus]